LTARETSDVVPDGASDGFSYREVNAQGNVIQSGEVIAALVPDGNSTVSADGPADAQQNIPVSDNIAVAALPLGNITMTYRSATGALTSSGHIFTLPSTPESTRLKRAEVTR
jgi:hypothetical protein